MAKRPPTGERFPGLHDLRQGRDGFNQRMHVIRHDAPGQQPIALAVEMEQSVFHCLGHFGMRERAAPQACVEPALHPFAPLHVSSGTRLSRQLLIHLTKRFLRQGIGQAKGKRLNQPHFVAMGQISSRVPSQARNRLQNGDFSPPGVSPGSAELQLGHLGDRGRFGAELELGAPRFHTPIKTWPRSMIADTLRGIAMGAVYQERERPASTCALPAAFDLDYYPRPCRSAKSLRAEPGRCAGRAGYRAGSCRPIR